VDASSENSVPFVLPRLLRVCRILWPLSNNNNFAVLVDFNTPDNNASLYRALEVLGVLAISVVVATIPHPPRTRFADRVQGWSISLIINWVGAVGLLALGYLVSPVSNEDVVHYLLASPLDRIAWGSYPRIIDPATFVVYLVYSAAALGLIKLLLERFVTTAPTEAKTPLIEPNVVFIASLTALVMMVLHGATTLS
jgi:hypothetical protein